MGEKESEVYTNSSVSFATLCSPPQPAAISMGRMAKTAFAGKGRMVRSYNVAQTIFAAAPAFLPPQGLKSTPALKRAAQGGRRFRIRRKSTHLRMGAP